MKIMAVDDDPVILELLSEVLRVAGFSNLHLCPSAADALAMIDRAEIPFDCFLLDIQMPDTDGIELTAAIRRMPQHARTPILMITAMSERSYVDNAFAAGASDYITKPFEIGEVHARLRLIEQLVQERKQRDDRNSVEIQGSPVSLVSAADMERRHGLADIDGFIDYLALENYLMQVSRVSLFGMSVFGVVVPDMERTFQASSRYEYDSAVSDIAEGISDTIKPRQFLAAHAGGGQFVCVLTDSEPFDPVGFGACLHETMQDMDLHFCDGRPMILNPMVGASIALQLKSPRGVTNALVQSLLIAEPSTEEARSSATASPLKQLFRF